MTTAQCTSVMRLFVFMALAFGFLGFLANAQTASNGGGASPALGALQ